MNGRMYDPVIGRVLSPDAFVQDPSYTQSYNRYSYCLNNPLRYTDPSGWLTEAQWDEVKRTWNKMVSDPDNFTTGIYTWTSEGGAGGGGSFSFSSDPGDGYSALAAYNNEHDSWGNMYPNGADVVKHNPTKINLGMTWWSRTSDGTLWKNRSEAVWYEYKANSLTQSYESVSLLFNGSTLSLIDKGKTVFSAPAVSGRPLDDGTFDYSVERQKLGSTGPIPAGNYTINPKTTQWWTSQSFIQRTAAIFGKGTWPGGLFSWGVARTWITPDAANTYGRSGFTIHGGISPGSAGCIDLYGRELDFFSTLKKYFNLNKIPLIVIYK